MIYRYNTLLIFTIAVIMFKFRNNVLNFHSNLWIPPEYSLEYFGEHWINNGVHDLKLTSLSIKRQSCC